MATWKRRGLWLAWGLSFGLAVASASLVVQGVWRDRRASDPVIRLDFSGTTDWVSAPFRVWGDGTYDLLISSVNHDAASVGRPLLAAFEVQVVDPGGKPVLRRTYGPGSTGHHVPDNYGDARLATLELADRPLRAWSLQARVTQPDRDFATGRTEVKLYERRTDPGMGGLVNYVMILPAGIFMLLALILSVPFAKGGSRLPLLATGTAAFLMLFVLV